MTSRWERLAGNFIGSVPGVDFTKPPGEAALLPPTAVSWQIFRNPVTMMIGGISAVLLELGEPRVRAGVWDHSSFRHDPAGRLRRTGHAAMVTVYAARSEMEAMAARVRGLHSKIAGMTRAGEAYRADDPVLLRWVQGTAAFSFLAAYRAYVRDVSSAERDQYYAEGRVGGSLYGVEAVAASEAAIGRMVDEMRPRLEPSPILIELLDLVRAAPILPSPARGLQHMLVRAVVDLLPAALRAQLRLGGHARLMAAERLLLRGMAMSADRMLFPASPWAQACRRLGLPRDYLLSSAG